MNEKVSSCMDDAGRLELVAEAVRYCQRVEKMGMPMAGYAKTPREAMSAILADLS